LISSGGEILSVSARGGSKKSKVDAVREARNRCLRTLNQISIADKQYRTDIGLKVPQALDTLKGWF